MLAVVAAVLVVGFVGWLVGDGPLRRSHPTVNITAAPATGAVALLVNTTCGAYFQPSGRELTLMLLVTREGQVLQRIPGYQGMRWVLDLPPGHFEVTARPDPGVPGLVFSASVEVTAHKTTRLSLDPGCR